MHPKHTQCGFLPDEDPLPAFGHDANLAAPDELGRDPPSLLMEPGLAHSARRLKNPSWTPPDDPSEVFSQSLLYDVPVGILASRCDNQVGEPPALKYFTA